MTLVRMTEASRSWVLGVAFVLFFSAECLAGQAETGGDTITFVCRELLGRPTDRSVALNLCSDTNVEIFVEYGEKPSVYGHHTPIFNVSAGIPVTLTIDSLLPDTRYFYRIRYRSASSPEFLARDEHTWQTARPRGRRFVFAVEADPHLDSSTNPSLYRCTLGNILSSGADFMIDLGDSFMSDKLPAETPEGVLSRHLLLRSFFDTLGHSIPLMLSIGNHEGELGWLLNGTPDNLAVLASHTRISYFPNPLPNSFYSGDTTEEDFVGLRQNYYAWEWGDALFVVLDPYWYTTRKPGSSGDNWDWTLGRTQYEWFKETLERSTAGFKFVFAHQLIGGSNTEGRGGIEAAPYFEMGGLNSDGSQGFATHRPGWPMPIHQLMVENHVTAFFHGHDHVYVKQELDGIVYQELPQPGFFNYTTPEKSYSNTNLASKYGYTHGTVVSSSGFLRITVDDTSANVDYVRSYLPEHENSLRHNGEVAFSYLLRPSGVATGVGCVGASPTGFSLSQNYPNPFNPNTEISFTIPLASAVKLEVFNPLGQRVCTLVDGMLPSGLHTVPFSAVQYPSGVYVCRLKTESGTAGIKMICLK
jgi:hypothetical protein